MWRDYRLLQTTKEALEVCRTTEIIAIRLQSLNAGRIDACRRTQRGNDVSLASTFPRRSRSGGAMQTMPETPALLDRYSS